MEDLRLVSLGSFGGGRLTLVVHNRGLDRALFIYSLDNRAEFTVNDGAM